MSTVTHESVFRKFFARFPATIKLSVCAMLLALLIGLPAGVIAAVKRITVWEYPVLGASLTGFSMPIFWWGLLLILTFSEGSAGRRFRAASRSSSTSRPSLVSC